MGAGGTRCRVVGLLWKKHLISNSVTLDWKNFYMTYEAGGTRSHLVGLLWDKHLIFNSITFNYSKTKSPRTNQNNRNNYGVFHPKKSQHGKKKSKQTPNNVPPLKSTVNKNI